MSRRAEVARLASVVEDKVEPASVDEVRVGLRDAVAWQVLDVATQIPATYWRVAGHFYLDDPFFGDVVDIADLDYNSEIGLHVRRNNA